jgi:phospholipid/cholesterol/gamma-HCH transport system substrate-binding protein
MTRRRLSLATAVVLALLLVGAIGVVVRDTLLRPMTVTAYFTKATAIYPGDTVQVAGVEVGHIASIDADGTRTRLVLEVNHGVSIPADATAVIVAQNLIAARYVDLTPAYETGSGPTMADGAVIPLNRTAVPIEWDEVKEQLMRLASDLGPRNGTAPTSISRFIDSAANSLNGNGDKLRQTLAQLAQASRMLADGGGNIVDIIGNLQTFVSALKDSNTQIVQFENRFATLTSVLDEGRSDLDAAVTNLSSAVGEVQRFIKGSRNQTSEQIQRLADVTANLADHRTDLENVLHVAPNALANAYNIYNPDTASVMGSFALTPFANPVALICGAVGAIENITAPETAKLCAQYLGPGARLLNLNGLPFPLNPYLAPSAAPENIVYSDPSLAPGGSGPAPTPPEAPLPVSAYQPQPGPSGLSDLMLPGDAPAAPPSPAPPAPLPAEQALPSEAPPP